MVITNLFQALEHSSSTTSSPSGYSSWQPTSSGSSSIPQTLDEINNLKERLAIVEKQRDQVFQQNALLVQSIFNCVCVCIYIYVKV